MKRKIIFTEDGKAHRPYFPNHIKGLEKGIYRLPFNNGYKWAFQLNETDIILSRTQKDAKDKFVKFCAMDIKERKKAFYKLSDKERDWI